MISFLIEILFTGVLQEFNFTQIQKHTCCWQINLVSVCKHRCLLIFGVKGKHEVYISKFQNGQTDIINHHHNHHLNNMKYQIHFSLDRNFSVQKVVRADPSGSTCFFPPDRGRFCLLFGESCALKLLTYI